MTTAAEDPRTPGSVPNSWGNALAWRWVPAMPKGIPSGFVTLLYALRTMANAAGEVRFRDGKAIRIKDIAAAAKADEKDARRYLDAAISAGVVSVKGERRRGRSALYVLMLSPFPDWAAAADELAATRRKRAERKAPPWREEEGTKNGGGSPVLEAEEKGGPPPVLDTPEPEEERGTAPRMRTGDRPPFGSGDRPPNNPGIAKELPQEMAGPGEQPQESPGAGRTDFDHSQGQDDHAPAAPNGAPARCPRCTGPMITRPGRDICGGCDRRERAAS